MSASEMAIVPTTERDEPRGVERPGVRLDERTRVRLPTGTSPAIRGVIGLIRQVAEHESTVLILGESGTGKEVVARAIHDLSPRRQRPFVAVNCGAIPAELLESELFGHEKGAFTGAVAARKGRFEIAEGGTLFLDEIGDMSPTMQVKLLRVLQERVFERVGNHVPNRCNVRIIAATHRNLEEAIARAAFREDLFHRLNVFPIETPPLRERIEDLPLLVRDFIAHNVAEGRGHIELSPRALAALALHRWPGNVRELANLIERLSIVRGGHIAGVGDLPAKYRPADWTAALDPLTGEDSLGPQTPEEAPAALDGPARAALERLSREASIPVAGSGALSVAEAQALIAAASADQAVPGADAVARAPGGRADDDSESGELETDDSHRLRADGAAHAELTVLPADGLDLRAHLTAIERQLIEQALDRSGGTVAHAARLLKLRRTTLVEKMRKLGMTAEQASPAYGELATED